MTMIDNAMEYIKELFAGECSGHDYYHTLRVFQIATRLAEEEKADLTTVQLAALLHDTDDKKLFPDSYENKDKAVSFLKSQGAGEELIEAIVSIIREISFAGTDSVVPKTIEGKCVQDADRLDAIGAIGIARTFAYGGHRNQPMYDPEIAPEENMNAEKYYNNRTTTINHFYEKLFLLEAMMNTETAKAVAKERTQYMREFVDRFLNEWNGTDL